MRPTDRGAAGEVALAESAGQHSSGASVDDHGTVSKQAGSANLHGFSDVAVCELLNISRRSFYSAKKLLSIGCAELVAEVAAGAMSLHLALQIARATHDGQRLILGAIGGLGPRDRTRMVRLILEDAEQEAQ